MCYETEKMQKQELGKKHVIKLLSLFIIQSSDADFYEIQANGEYIDVIAHTPSGDKRTSVYNTSDNRDFCYRYTSIQIEALIAKGVVFFDTSDGSVYASESIMYTADENCL